MTYCILGTHPANRSYSVVKYFNFYRSNLPGFLGSPIMAKCPGGTLPPDDTLPFAPRARIWWENYVEWPLTLLSQRSDLTHFADHGLLWSAPFLRGGRRLATVHDLINYMSVRGTLSLASAPAKQRPVALASIRQIAHLDHIVSVSQSTADCIVSQLGIPANRITMIPNHVDTAFMPAASPAERDVFRARWFGAAPQAVIHVGQPTRYKNRIGAIQAFALLRKRMPEAQLFLVSGPATSDERKLIAEAGYGAFVTYIPATSLAGLREIYSAADALVFPSLYEGFGWPPLEAMACGCPVVSSTRGSLREVLGDAALTTDDPFDNEFIASALVEILSDPAAAQQLRAAGTARAQLFSPEKSLAAMANVYRMLN
jgi:glycosyltransferase involved in cell wall biosynthesis